MLSTSDESQSWDQPPRPHCAVIISPYQCAVSKTAPDGVTWRRYSNRIGCAQCSHGRRMLEPPPPHPHPLPRLPPVAGPSSSTTTTTPRQHPPSPHRPLCTELMITRAVATCQVCCAEPTTLRWPSGDSSGERCCRFESG